MRIPFPRRENMPGCRRAISPALMDDPFTTLPGSHCLLSPNICQEGGRGLSAGRGFPS